MRESDRTEAYAAPKAQAAGAAQATPTPATRADNRSAITSARERQRSAPHLSAATPTYAGPTYYGQPSVKASLYGPLVWQYLFVGGLAGGAQVLATLASLTSRSAARRARSGAPPALTHRSVIDTGRTLGLVGAAVGGALLIADLHTPRRFANMLRIFRKTSPMSIGSYVLMSFAGSTGLSLLGTLFHGRWAQRIARMAQPVAGLSGAGMTVYTGALLASTSTPYWASQPRLLPMRFGSSAVATAAAALAASETLRGHAAEARRLDRIALLAAMAEAACGAAGDARYRARHAAVTPRMPLPQDGATAQGVPAASVPLHAEETEYRHARQQTSAATAGMVVPLVCWGINALLPRRSRALGLLGAFSMLAGGLMMRAAVLNEGNRSARRPEEYLGMTQATEDEARADQPALASSPPPRRTSSQEGDAPPAAWHWPTAEEMSHHQENPAHGPTHH